MILPKKCGICHCIDERDSATCGACGEASWLPVYVPGVAPALEPVNFDAPALPKPKKGKR
jgi:hypothetical protein